MSTTNRKWVKRDITCKCRGMVIKTANVTYNQTEVFWVERCPEHRKSTTVEWTHQLIAD